MALKTKVGLFFLIAAILLAGLTFMVEDLGDLFEKGYILKVRLKEAEVEEGSPVKLAGVKVGKVKNVVVKEKEANPVEVTLRIQDGVAIYDTYVAKVVLSSLIGKASVVLDMHYEKGKSRKLKNGEVIPLTAETVSLDSVLVDAKKTVADIRAMVAKARSGEGTIGKLVMTEDGYAEFKAAIDSFHATFDNAASITASIKDDNASTIGRLLYDHKLGQRVDDAVTDVKDTFANAKTITASIKDGKGAVGKLVNDEEMANDAKELVASAKKGFDNVQAVTQNIKDGKGTLGRLNTDEKLAQDVSQGIKGFRDTLDNAKDITSQVRKGEGSVGKLIYEDKLVKSAQEILDSVQSALEDFRESAPVASFAGAILGAF